MANRHDLLRAWVGLMKTLAAAYGIMIPASQRAATDEEVKKWYKKLIRRVHPDKGGCNGDFGLSSHPVNLTLAYPAIL